MVRLEARHLGVLLISPHYFNSYMVRLEDKITWDTLEEIALFQFLYGAIGSQMTGAGVQRVLEFQFLYGAIGRINGIEDFNRKLNFNSYMVRLEGDRKRVVQGTSNG